MTRARTACLTAALAAACGPEGLPPAELAAVCEANAPVRVLALEPGEVLYGAPLTVGERTVYPISRHEPPDGEFDVLNTSFAAVWSTGPCGESPVKLDPEVRYPFTREAWPGLLFARAPMRRPPRTSTTTCSWGPGRRTYTTARSSIRSTTATAAGSGSHAPRSDARMPSRLRIVLMALAASCGVAEAPHDAAHTQAAMTEEK